VTTTGDLLRYAAAVVTVEDFKWKSIKTVRAARASVKYTKTMNAPPALQYYSAPNGCDDDDISDISCEARVLRRIGRKLSNRYGYRQRQ